MMHTFDNNSFINPSFSSTLLDQIYRSIDEGDRKSTDMKFYREPTTTVRKQSRSNAKVDIQGRQHNISQMHHHRVHDHERDVMFFSSVSNSSDSSSGTLSSSDTESLYGMRSKASCFVPYPKPKPVRTNVSEKADKKISERKQGNMFLEKKKDLQIFDSYSIYSHNSNIESNEEVLIKSKSRAMKIYNNLKKVKQPISPGGKLTSFLNKLFATGNNAKKSNTTSTVEGTNTERKAQATSTCSSASSFSRSCLSKNSPSLKETLGVKRTVRFSHVSVIVDEDCRPCGHKSLYEEKELQTHQKRSNFFPTTIEDDGESDSSSDLFELDHLTVFGDDDRYFEELPVYETTNLSTNRAIANARII